ncbi:MAG TPA: hypothetical protein VJT16_04055 [Streptosporangiaceae bacterium]|nr:hypothetical protein [Streptosporangiaceae bacterium]
MPDDLVRCPNCRRRNRVPAASGTPRCAKCHRPLPWIVDSTDDTFADVMPNWNSCTMPVTTPIAKLMRNSTPKNLASRPQMASCRRYACTWMTATSIASPIVSGTNTKW